MQITVNGESRWVVSDWGLVRLHGQTTFVRTLPGQPFGTFGYAAPELWEDAHLADESSDIYSLGRVIAWCITGKTPVPNRPLIPDGKWREFIELTTAANNSDRWQSMADVISYIKHGSSVLLGEFKYHNVRDIKGSVAPYIADVDGDGANEMVIATREGISIFRTVGEEMERIPVEDIGLAGWGWTRAFFLADVDNDGSPELIRKMEFDTSEGLICYKYVNNEFVALKGVDPDDQESRFVLFHNATVVDKDDDGNLELDCQPWGAIPEDLIPAEYLKMYGDDPIYRDPWGYVSYVWKWDSLNSWFKLVSREFLHIGGR